MAYGYIGEIRTHPERREEVVDILLSGLDRLAEVGCRQYVVAVADSDEVTIWVNEVWDSKEQHEASLELAATKEAIARAMPLIAGFGTRVETTVRGGLGVSAA
jgi:quinol monooxygenase YgiN